MRSRIEEPTEVGPTPSDAALGIGEEDNPIAALLNHPDVARLIDVAVQARLAQIGGGAVADMSGNAGLAAIVAGIERLTTMHAAQLPGYSRPLPVEEIERRAEGFVDMQALVRRCEETREFPRYRLVGEPLFAGEIEYRPGSEIETLLYPNEHMMPLNEPARRVHEAMMRWIGGPQIGIAERVEEAEKNRNILPVGDRNSPFARAGLPETSPVQIVADPPEERAFDPRRPPQAAHQVEQPYRV